MKENPDKGRKGSVSAAVTDGRRIDFLGYCFTHGNVRLRKSIKKSFARKEKKIRTAKTPPGDTGFILGLVQMGQLPSFMANYNKKRHEFFRNGNNRKKHYQGRTAFLRHT